MWPAFPASDYYGASVAVGVSPVRRSHIPLAVHVQDGLGASFVPFFGPLKAALPPGACWGRNAWLRPFLPCPAEAGQVHGGPGCLPAVSGPGSFSSGTEVQAV